MIVQLCSIIKDDIALIYEYLIASPDGTVSNIKLLFQPFQQSDSEGRSGTSDSINNQLKKDQKSFYGRVHDLISRVDKSNVPIESNVSGYLLGPHPWFIISTSHEFLGLSSDLPQSSHLLTPRIFLTNGVRALLVVFLVSKPCTFSPNCPIETHTTTRFKSNNNHISYIQLFILA